MISKSIQVNNVEEFEGLKAHISDVNPDVIIAIGSVDWFEDDKLKSLRGWSPNTEVIGCSSAGEICEDGVYDSTLVVGLMKFTSPKFKVVSSSIQSMDASHDCGRDLANQWEKDRLTSVFMLGRGLDINGSKLIEGIQSVTGMDVPISGGLAGDGGAFQTTYVLHNDQIFTDRVVGMGVYDNSILISNGSRGGWKPFGPIRKVTKATENVLFEIDGVSALKIYKEYLGDQAAGLPASGLLFPLETLQSESDERGLIRTILAVDEDQGSITLAGEVVEGQLVRLMHTNNSGLVGGAEDASKHCSEGVEEGATDGLAFLTSCVGRKLVMGDDIDDEVEAVKENLGVDNIIGFYSYGEISPHHADGVTKLHNQTMTISYFWEKAS